MADAITPQLGLTNPEVGGSQNTWGGKLNENFSLLDSFVASRVLRSGDTMSGALGIVPGTPTAPGLFFSGDSNTGIYQPAANQWAISIDGTPRFSLSATTTEIANNLSVTGTTSLQSLSATTINATGNAVISTSSANPALRITQTGTGEALRVEDEANPDATPFVIDAAGNVGVGGSVTLGGATPRLLANMSGAQASRFAIQNSTTNGNTRFFLYPNGTGTISAINGKNNSNPDATDFQEFDLAVIGASDVRLSSSANGAAPPLPLTFYTNGAERLRIDPAGNLGLGATPSAWGGGSSVFEMKGGANVMSTTDAMLVRANAFFNGSQNIYKSNGFASFYSQLSGSHAFFTAASGTAGAIINFGDPKMTLTQGGNLLVGTTSDAANYRVNIQQNGQDVNGIYCLSTAASSDGSVLLSLGRSYAVNNTIPFVSCVDSAATRAEIRNNGGIANFQANNVNLSDRREKTNFAPAGEYLSKICAIPVQTFNYIDQNMEDDPGTTLGVVAQDVEAVAPELVMESNWGTEDNPKMRLSIYQTDLQYALMKCIQEQQTMIAALESRLAALESK